MEESVARVESALLNEKHDETRQDICVQNKKRKKVYINVCARCSEESQPIPLLRRRTLRLRPNDLAVAVEQEGDGDHTERDECPYTGSPAVAEVVVHRGDEQRHGCARAGTYDGLSCEGGGDVTGEGVDDVGVGGEIDRDHAETEGDA